MLKQKKFLHIIHSRTRDLLNIINDIVDISKIEANQLKLYPEHFNLNELLYTLFETHYLELQTAGKAGVDLKMEKSLPWEKSFITTDPHRLKQILDNLLSNAVKFTEQGNIEFGYYSPQDRQFPFYVQDSGIGISADHQKSVFDSFWQEEDSESRNYQGTGLGLAISKNLVELLGGQIQLESQKGGGTRFTFTLPLYAKSNAPPAALQQATRADYHWDDKVILVVEDDPVSQDYLAEVLTTAHVQILTAEQGQEALRIIEEKAPIDLILMDIRLPDVSGMEVMRMMREKAWKGPVIAQTAYAMGEDHDKFLKAGADDYIAKPIDAFDLLSMVNRFLGEKD